MPQPISPSPPCLPAAAPCPIHSGPSGLTPFAVSWASFPRFLRAALSFLDTAIPQTSGRPPSRPASPWESNLQVSPQTPAECAALQC